MKHETKISLSVFAVVLATVFAVPVDVGVDPADATFTFAAAADTGSTETGGKSKVLLQALRGDLASLSFFVAVGVLSYSTAAGTEGAWCGYVKSYVGPSFPFELLGADHEDNDPVRIANFTACLPDKLSSTGQYGKEFYFDVPAGAPLARFIQISPDMTFLPDVKWKYAINDSHYQWAMKAIDGGRAAGTRWGIGSAHRPPTGLRGPSCPIGQGTLY